MLFRGAGLSVSAKPALLNTFPEAAAVKSWPPQTPRPSREHDEASSQPNASNARRPLAPFRDLPVASEPPGLFVFEGQQEPARSRPVVAGRSRAGSCV